MEILFSLQIYSYSLESNSKARLAYHFYKEKNNSPFFSLKAVVVFFYTTFARPRINAVGTSRLFMLNAKRTYGVYPTGPVNTLLSWKALVPLSRLTYCAYLIHILILYYFFFSQRSFFYLDNTNIVSR